MNKNIKKAYFAGGCFWGVEHFFQKLDGVISTQVGYIGGHTDNPTYEQICQHDTGHAEAVEVVYNSDDISFEEIAKLFFEIHDFTQIDRQGPDVGDQYRSEVFYTTDKQKETTQNIINILSEKGYEVATKVTLAKTFWPGEEYHQRYYEKNGQQPYCHVRKEIFN